MHKQEWHLTWAGLMKDAVIMSSFRSSVRRRWSFFQETGTTWRFRPEEDQRNTKWPAGCWSVVDVSPMMKQYWRQNPAGPTTCAFLFQISPLTKQEEGFYECHAANTKGEASAVGAIHLVESINDITAKKGNINKPPEIWVCRFTY